MDGVSLTHGDNNTRTHIWTFAAAPSEIYDGRFTNRVIFAAVWQSKHRHLLHSLEIITSVKVVSTSTFSGTFIFYPDDPLWDGQNCVSDCCEFNTPPYFTRTLPAPTSDDIELRICNLHSGYKGDIAIDQVELYVN